MEKTVMKRLVSVIVILTLIFSLAFAFLNSQSVAHADSSNGQKNIVTTQTTQWQYRDDNRTPADGWKTSERVTDAAWKTAKGSFGAKRGAISNLGGGCVPQTLLKQYIDGSSNDIPVYYFRTTFDVTDIAAVQGISGTVVYDDAATVYVNGVKIAGFDDGSFDANGYGGSNASDPISADFSYTDISKLNLKATGNVLAVELHNGRAGSSDIYLDVKDITLQTGTPAAKEEEVKDLSLNIGGTQTERNAAWLATSVQDEYLQVAEKSADYKEGDAFPEKTAVVYKADKETSSVSGFYSCKAGMKDLKEKTTYLYRVGNDEKWSDVYTFTTQDFGTADSYSFLFAGDPQIGASGNAGNDTTNWQKTMESAMKAFPDTSFLLSAGDQVNSRNNDAQYDGYLSPSALRQIPMAVNVGNHDNGDKRYTDYYNMPNVSDKGVTSNTGAQGGDYWFMYNGTLFMSLNSNNTSTAEHKAFMKEAMDANLDAIWNVVTFHHSTYSVANHYTDSDVIQRRKDLSPVFSELGIDVVLMGHDHYYTRTYMMEGSNPVIPEGNDVSKGEEAPSVVNNPSEGQVLYLTANSASGSKYYSLNGSISQNGMPNYVAVQDQSRRTSITNVTVTKNTFTVDTYYTDGDTPDKMDSFTIRRTEAPTITVDETDTALKTGQAFNPMTGVTAKDCDGNDLTDQVYVTVYKVNGENKDQVSYVDSSKEGTYEISYSVEDAYGKTATAERKVTVKTESGNTGDNGNNGNTGDNGNGGNTGDSGNTGIGNNGNSGNTGDNGNNGNGGNIGSTGNTANTGNHKITATADKTTNGHSSAVKTGDTMLPIILFVAVMGVAGITVTAAMKKKTELKK